MNRNRIVQTGTVLGLATLAFAHHVPVGLSHVSGAEILEEIVFFTEPGVFGVPAYNLGTDEAPDDDAVGITDGDSFSVRDQNGNTQTITLDAADFADIDEALLDEVIDVINEKATIFEASEANGYLAFRSLIGGSAAMLETQDGAGAPLAKLGMSESLVNGSDDLELTISIPDVGIDLAGRPYFVLASTTPGSFQLGGHTIPVGYDDLTARTMNAARHGAAMGFAGTLNATSDASAHLTASQLQQVFAGGFPDAMYLTFVVLDRGPGQFASASTGMPGRIAYVSNVFTVDFQ